MLNYIPALPNFMVKRNLLSIIGKTYTYEILSALKEEKRFKELAEACLIEKMRTERLKELESAGLVKVRVERIGRRPVSIYGLTDSGKKILKLAEEMSKVKTI